MAKREASEAGEASRGESERSELPSGWCWATVGEVITEMKNGISTTPDGVEGTPILRISAVRPGSVDTSDVRFLNSNVDLSGYFLQPNDLLFTRYNGNPALVGACGRVVQVHGPLVFPDKLIRVRADSSLVLSEWIEFSARASATRAHIDDHSKSAAGQVGISGADLRRAPVAVPPLAEQRRIVAKLEEMLGRIRRARAALDAVPAMVERYKKSVLGAAFRGELTTHSTGDGGEQLVRSLREARAASSRKVSVIETPAELHVPVGWGVARVGEIFRVEVGATPSRTESAYWGGKIPWVSSGEVRFLPIHTTKERITERALADSSTKLMPAGTILLGMIGEGKTRGQCAVLEIEACTNQNVASIVVRDTNIPPYFVYHWLTLQYETVRASGAGNSQPALNKARVEAIEIPLPPLDEQRAIVARIDAAFARARTLLSAAETARAQLDTLERSLLAKAFRGELVPQDPSDEPASALLERVRAERSTTPAKKPRKPKGAPVAGVEPVARPIPTTPTTPTAELDHEPTQPAPEWVRQLSLAGRDGMAVHDVRTLHASSDVDAFYRDLRHFVAKGLVREERRDNVSWVIANENRSTAR